MKVTVYVPALVAVRVTVPPCTGNGRIFARILCGRVHIQAVISRDSQCFFIHIIADGHIAADGFGDGRAQDFELYGGSCCADKVVRAFYDIFEEVVACIDGNVPFFPFFPFFIFAVCGSRPCIIGDDAFKTACFGIGSGAFGRARRRAVCPICDGKRAVDDCLRLCDIPCKFYRTGSDVGVASPFAQ